LNVILFYGRKFVNQPNSPDKDIFSHSVTITTLRLELGQTYLNLVTPKLLVSINLQLFTTNQNKEYNITYFSIIKEDVVQMIKPSRKILIAGSIHTLEIFESGTGDLIFNIILNENDKVVGTVKAESNTLLNLLHELCSSW